MHRQLGLASVGLGLIVAFEPKGPDVCPLSVVASLPTSLSPVFLHSELDRTGLIPLLSHLPHHLASCCFDLDRSTALTRLSSEHSLSLVINPFSILSILTLTHPIPHSVCRIPRPDRRRLFLHSFPLLFFSFSSCFVCFRTCLHVWPWFLVQYTHSLYVILILLRCVVVSFQWHQSRADEG